MLEDTEFKFWQCLRTKSTRRCVFFIDKRLGGNSYSFYWREGAGEVYIPCQVRLLIRILYCERQRLRVGRGTVGGGGAGQTVPGLRQVIQHRKEKAPLQVVSPENSYISFLHISFSFYISIYLYKKNFFIK